VTGDTLVLQRHYAIVQGGVYGGCRKVSMFPILVSEVERIHAHVGYTIQKQGIIARDAVVIRAG
jgi:hypothetical protein